MTRELRIEATRFVLVGGIGFSVNYLVLFALNSVLGINHVLSELISLLVALHATFLLHNKWTYLQRRKELVAGLQKRYKLFMVSNLAGSTITLIAFAVIRLAIESNFVSLGLAAISGMTWNFFMNSIVVWKKKSPAE